MNILFLTLVNVKSLEEKNNIYADLCRCMIEHGNTVHVVCPTDGDADVSTNYDVYRKDNSVLKVRTGKVQKTNIIRKGFSTLLIGQQLKRAIKKYHANNRFDMIIYSTPPITVSPVVSFIKRRDNAVSYLLLKDIFPQNAVDLGMMQKTGLKAILYKYFRYKEKELYSLSDTIGCMSEKNVEYLLSNNEQISKDIVHVSPNSIETTITRLTKEQKEFLREKYDIPKDKTVFIYGGNIGKPQGVQFIIECLKAVANKENVFFVVCGNGTDFTVLRNYLCKQKQDNFMLLSGLPRDEYEEFVGCCDIGLLFLDYRFTIPNFPSRLLSYMQKSMPIIACTDMVTDIGTTIEEGKFGWWCPSNDVEKFVEIVDKTIEADICEMGRNASDYLKQNFSVEKSCEIISEAYNNVMMKRKEI